MLVELRALEADDEGGDHGHRRRHEIVGDDERFLEMLPIHQGRGRGGAGGIRRPRLCQRGRGGRSRRHSRLAPAGLLRSSPLAGEGTRGASAPTGQGGRPFHAGGAMPPSPTLPRNGGEGLSPCRCSSCKAAPGTGAPVRGEGLFAGARLNH